jgi:hypothetical protein
MSFILNRFNMLYISFTVSDDLLIRIAVLKKIDNVPETQN